jgi:hypothetical protein
MMLPKASIPSYLLRDPFNWKVRERKSKLKIKKVTVDSMLMKRKDVIKHNAIASKKSPRTRRLLSNFIHSLALLFHNAH